MILCIFCISCDISSFISNFYLSFLFFLVSLAKGLSILCSEKSLSPIDLSYVFLFCISLITTLKFGVYFSFANFHLFFFFSSLRYGVSLRFFWFFHVVVYHSEIPLQNVCMCCCVVFHFHLSQDVFLLLFCFLVRPIGCAVTGCCNAIHLLIFQFTFYCFLVSYHCGPKTNLISFLSS